MQGLDVCVSLFMRMVFLEVVALDLRTIDNNQLEVSFVLEKCCNKASANMAVGLRLLLVFDEDKSSLRDMVSFICEWTLNSVDVKALF